MLTAPHPQQDQETPPQLTGKGPFNPAETRMRAARDSEDTGLVFFFALPIQVGCDTFPDSIIRLFSLYPAPSRAAPLLSLETAYHFRWNHFRCIPGPTWYGCLHLILSSRLQYMPTYFKHGATASAKIH